MTKLPPRYFEEPKASRSKIQLGGGHLSDGFLAGLKFSMYARTLVFVYATSRCAKEKREYEEHVCVLNCSFTCVHGKGTGHYGWLGGRRRVQRL